MTAFEAKDLRDGLRISLVVSPPDRHTRSFTVDSSDKRIECRWWNPPPAFPLQVKTFNPERWYQLCYFQRLNCRSVLPLLNEATNSNQRTHLCSCISFWLSTVNVSISFCNFCEKKKREHQFLLLKNGIKNIRRGLSACYYLWVSSIHKKLQFFALYSFFILFLFCLTIRLILEGNLAKFR